MTTKNPATPLPWAATAYGLYGPARPEDGRIADFMRTKDAAYARHAANAYPKLVEALRNLREAADAGSWKERRKDEADALLRELEEAS
jgi:hypothetical protein